LARESNGSHSRADEEERSSGCKVDSKKTGLRKH